MELYIGGFFQGKTELVKKLYPSALFFDENDFEKIETVSDSEIIVWNHFHLCLKNGLTSTADEKLFHDKIWNIINSTDSKLIIISDEIGNGIVPVAKAERLWREFTGRFLCEIAGKSDSVFRISCGIAQKLK